LFLKMGKRKKNKAALSPFEKRKKHATLKAGGEVERKGRRLDYWSKKKKDASGEEIARGRGEGGGGGVLGLDWKKRRKSKIQRKKYFSEKGKEKKKCTSQTRLKV